MTITGGTALSKEEIDRMQKDAEAFAEEDHKRRETAEVRNTADQLTYQVDKALVDYGDKIPAEDREAVTTANDELKEALKGEDTDRIRSVTESLMQAFQRVGQAMYSQQQAATAGSGEGESAPDDGAEGASTGDGDVVEGEIVDEGSAS